jgi:hypothetical protein
MGLLVGEGLLGKATFYSVMAGLVPAIHVLLDARIGATGSILIGTLLDELERRDLKRGLVTMCAAGGMAPAVIVEPVHEAAGSEASHAKLIATVRAQSSPPSATVENDRSRPSTRYLARPSLRPR